MKLYVCHFQCVTDNIIPSCRSLKADVHIQTNLKNTFYTYGLQLKTLVAHKLQISGEEQGRFHTSNILLTVMLQIHTQ